MDGKLSRLSLPPGRLKLGSIVLLLLVLLSVVTAQQQQQLEQHDQQKEKLLSSPQRHRPSVKQDDQNSVLVTSTTEAGGIETKTETGVAMDPSLIASPGAEDSLVAGEGEKRERATSRTTDTISNIPDAFSTTTTSDQGGEGAGVASPTDETWNRTIRAVEAELLPQNDQPVVEGQSHEQHEEEEEEDADDHVLTAAGGGLDSVGGYYRSHNKMSNGSFVAGSGHQPQERQPLTIQCPSLKENSACPCYRFDDGE